MQILTDHTNLHGNKPKPTDIYSNTGKYLFQDYIVNISRS